MNILNRLRRMVGATNPPPSGSRRTNSTRRRVNAKPPANTIRRTNSSRPSQSSLRNARRNQVTGGTARTTGTGTTTRTARPATATSGTSTGRGAKGTTQGRRSSDSTRNITPAQRRALLRQQQERLGKSTTTRTRPDTTGSTRPAASETRTVARPIRSRNQQVRDSGTQTAPKNLKTKARPASSGTRSTTAAERRQLAEAKTKRRQAVNRAKNKETTADKRTRREATRDGGSTRVAPGTKDGNKTRKTVSRETRLTKAQRDRRSLTNRRDIGAQAAAAKTPKGRDKTARQAGGPARKGSTPKEGPQIYDQTASRRDGKATLGRPQPKATNAKLSPEGRLKDLASFQGGLSADAVRDRADRAISKELRRLTDQGVPTAERKRVAARLKKGKTQLIKKARAEGTSTSTKNLQDSKDNVSPSSAYQGRSYDMDNDRYSGRDAGSRDWRNRMSDSKVRGMSERQTQRNSGVKVRGADQALQSPKGRGQNVERTSRSAHGAAQRGTGSYQASGTGGDIPASTRESLMIADPVTLKYKPGPTAKPSEKGQLAGQTATYRTTQGQTRTAGRANDMPRSEMTDFEKSQTSRQDRITVRQTTPSQRRRINADPTPRANDGQYRGTRKIGDKNKPIRGNAPQQNVRDARAKGNATRLVNEMQRSFERGASGAGSSGW